MQENCRKKKASQLSAPSASPVQPQPTTTTTTTNPPTRTNQPNRPERKKIVAAAAVAAQTPLPPLVHSSRHPGRRRREETGPSAPSEAGPPLAPNQRAPFFLPLRVAPPGAVEQRLGDGARRRVAARWALVLGFYLHWHVFWQHCCVLIKVGGHRFPPNPPTVARVRSI